MESMETINQDSAAAKAPRDSESKYQRLYESMTDAFASTDMQGRITEVNPAFEKLVGYTAKELLELSYTDLTPEKWHPLETRIFGEQIIPYGCSEIYQKEYRRKDGSIVPVELRIILTRDSDGNPEGMWAIVRDITERIRLEQALRDSNALLENRVEERTAELRDSEARFRRLAEVSFEAISVTENGIIVDINTQCSKMLGWERRELVGRSVLEFVRPEFRELVTRHVQEGDETPYQCEIQRKNGDILPCEVHGRMTDWQGRRLRVTAIRDLTEAKRVKAQLAKQKATLARFQRMALLSEVSAGVVHQISQPISAIVNNVAAVRVMIAECEDQQCGAMAPLLDINSDLDRLRDTIDRLRTLAHPERQNHSPQFLEPILRDAIRDVELDAKEHQVSIAMNCPADLPRVSADATQLTQVLINLLQNAIDAVSSRPPDQRLVTASVRAPAGREVEIAIRDSGTGISPEAQGRLFEPLFTTKKHGTGIGLALSRTITNAHHGRIEGLNNKDQPGATFRVLLPVEGGPK